jgi:NADPH-dependent glutamate synthase beta subunit-like oxidoreductase/NAD(P)H-flavin reductase
MQVRSSPDPVLRLGIGGFEYADLASPTRLGDLHGFFWNEVRALDPALAAEWSAAPAELPVLAESDLLVRLAPHVGRFVAKLFDVEAEARALAEATRAEDPLFRFKVEFVRRRALALLKDKAHVEAMPADEARVAAIFAHALAGDREMALAVHGCSLLDRDKLVPSGDPGRAALDAEIASLARWCAAHVHDPAFKGWVAFRFPENLDPFALVPVIQPRADLPEAVTGPDERLRRRDGFALTDERMRPRAVLSEIHYCILCHERDKDSCSKGLHAKDGGVQKNALGIELAGCPLDEKISEMHTLRKRGDAIAALALVMIDNPMCAGTGHRICNDCMKACIYQKQEPVNIPEIETGVLTDVLRLPWGVEIYGFLARWNPLNRRRPHALPYNGKNVLVVGMGPAGYTLAHYLTSEGFGVAGIDGLKIEPLPAEWIGGDGKPARPIRDWSEIYRPLDERVLEGFGGVSEYGITVRWDKNFLTLIHLTLARRDLLRIYGGVRFGGTITLDDAWGLGFDHVAIASGAGRPTVIDMKHNLIRGVRKASDFLMALQLTGAFKRHALPNLAVRLPAIVIGGGLTGIDTATEALAYYPVQVAKILERYEALVLRHGEEKVRQLYDPEERAQLDEFLAHGRAVRAERERAAAAHEKPDFITLVRGWGGVALCYRKRMIDAPAYRLNHEEVMKALEEGITFVENVDPEEVIADDHGHVRALRFKRTSAKTGEESHVTLPARSVLVAAGTSPNVIPEKEAPGTFLLDAKARFFQSHRAVQANGIWSVEPAANGFFTSYSQNGRLVSFYGDNHPAFAGNVVKAMASAKKGYVEVVRLFEDEIAPHRHESSPVRDARWRSLVAKLDDELLPRVDAVRRLTPTIIEIIVRAPAAARRFQPGQFYRLQNFEALAPEVDADGVPTKLLMEGIALTGAWVDREKGLLSMIALELGVSSRLCAYLRPGEPVIVMGPTGAPTEIPRDECALLAGGGLGNAVLFSIGKALRAAGCKVVYFAGYKKGEDIFKQDDVESSADQVIWSTDSGADIKPRRPQDHHVRMNIVQAMLAYAKGELGEQLVPMHHVDRVIAIGSDRMMRAVKESRHGVLAPYMKPQHVGIGSINSPMQCMMKEVCAQCLQKHVDPLTGKETFVFSCFNQDQHLDHVDFPHLAARLRQNTVQEKLAAQWLDYLLAGQNLQHA